MNGVLLAWVLKKAWQVDVNVVRTKSLIGNGAEFENDTRLNREPVKIFQK